MKQLIFITILFFLHLNNCSSQIVNQFGLKGGIIYTGFNSSDDEVLNSISSLNFISFDLGIYAEFFDKRYFNISTELHYIVKGERNSNAFLVPLRENTSQGNVWTFKYMNDTYQYLSLMLLPRYKFLLTNEDKLYLFGGPRFDFRIGNTNSDSENSLHVSNFKLELGGTVGIGGQFRDVLLMELRFEYNFTPTYQFEYGEEKTTRNHNTLAFLLGVNLRKVLRLDL